MHRTIYNTLPPRQADTWFPSLLRKECTGVRYVITKFLGWIFYSLPIKLSCPWSSAARASSSQKGIFDSSLKLCVHLMKLALKIPWSWRKIRHFESLTDATGYICPALNARRPRIRDIIRWENRTHKPLPPDGEAAMKGLPAFFARANQTGQTPTSAPTKFLIS